MPEFSNFIALDSYCESFEEEAVEDAHFEDECFRFNKNTERNFSAYWRKYTLSIDAESIRYKSHYEAHVTVKVVLKFQGRPWDNFRFKEIIVANWNRLAKLTCYN